MTVSNIAATGYNPPSAMSSLNDLLGAVGTVQGIKQRNLALQSAQLGLQQQDFATQAQQQANEERKAQIEMFKNGDIPFNADGTFNLGHKTQDVFDGKTPIQDGSVPPAGTPKLGAMTVAQNILQRMPQTGMDFVKGLQATNQQTIAANKAALGLDQDTLKGIGDVSTSVMGKPASERSVALHNYLDSLSPAAQARAQPIANQMFHTIDQVSADPNIKDDNTRIESLDRLMGHFGARVNGLLEQKAARTPNILDTGGGFKNVGPDLTGAAVTPTGGQVATKTLSPAERNQLITNPVTGQQQAISRSATGAYNLGGAGGPLTAIPPGETAETGKAFQGIRAAANQAALQAPTLASNNQQVLNLLKTTTTGTNAETAKKILGSIGLQWSNDEATNLSSIQHYLAQNLTAQAKAMGVPNTNEGQEAAQAVTGGINMPREALARAVKANDALTTASQTFNSGLENSIKQYKGPGDPIFAARNFQNQWSKVFDPEVFKYGNAVRDGDTAAIAQIEKEHGGKGSDTWAAFQAKAKALRSLRDGAGQ